MNWPTISVPTITRRKRKWLYRPLGMLLILFPISLLASLLSQVRQGTALASGLPWHHC